MSDILFKAQRIDNGEWIYWNVYGDLCRENGKLTRLSITKGATTSYYDYIHQVYQLINQDTICQYTRYTDKNGKKIWENDVVIYDNSPYNVYCEPHQGQIVCRHGCFSLKYLLYGSITYKSFITDDFFEKKCEVIGNVFDNKELLEGQV